ncbi:MAG: hypothetical protein H7Z37_17495 [Pyrinomonadaceae bacterium]|nr:hypothetical protein [Pyrinomonadaceae bacterium]
MIKNAILIKLMLGVIILIASAETAYSCRCIKQTLKTNYQRADAVIVATVIEINDKSENITEVKLQVSDAWKSDVTKTFVIQIGKTSCDITVELNQEYTLYLKKLDATRWTTNLCMGNLPKNDSAKASKWLRSRGKQSRVS